MELVPLLDKLYSLSYISAKELLHEIDIIEKEPALNFFWRLACILYDDEQDKLQSNFDAWIHEAIFDSILEDCDEFLHALFVNDIKEKKRIAQEIFSSKEIALVFDSSTRSADDAKNVPSCLQNMSFRYGENSIPGSAVWALMVGDISYFFSLDLPWTFLFALHFWNSDDITHSKFLAAFTSFCNISQSKIKNLDQDPIYLLLKYYSSEYDPNNADKLLSDIASLLPPLDMFFFLKIFQAIDHNVSENSISLALNICQYQLIQMGCLIEAVDLLNNHTKENSQEILQLAQYVASPNRGLTEIERHLIKNCPDVLDKKYIYYFKGNKAQLLQEFFKGSKSLDYAGRATDFFLEAAGISQKKQETTTTSSTINSFSYDSNDGNSGNATNSNDSNDGNSGNGTNSNDSNDSNDGSSGNGTNSNDGNNENAANSNNSDDSDFNENELDQEDINSEYFEFANYQAYNVYLVKSMIKGEGINRLFEWSGKFAKYPEIADMSDESQIYKIFEAIKVARSGGIVEPSQLETIADEIKKNTKLYPRFRYFVATSELYKQPNGFALFSELEMMPKEKLLEIYESAFQ